MATKLKYIAVAVLAVIALGACSPGFGSPEAGAESFFVALESQEISNINDALCEAQQDLITEEMFGSDETEIEFNFDFRFDSREEDDTTFVRVFGTSRVRVENDDFSEERRADSKDDTPLFELRMAEEDGDWKVCDSNALLNIVS